MSDSNKTIQTQLAIIGSGPGGYAAAFHAADKGMKVTLIDERETPGGVCLNVGCIPSKALLHISKLLHEARSASAWGITFAEPKIDLEALRTWKEKVIGGLTGGVKQLCKSRGVRVVRGRAVFIDSERLHIEDSSDVQVIEFDKAILATGSSPFIPPGLAVKSPRIMDSTGALALADIPGTLLVIGGGYIGLELGSVYAALGSKVTIVEVTDQLLTGVDRDLVRPVAARIKEIAHALYMETKVVKLEDTGSAVKVTFEGAADPLEQVFDRVLVSAGRRPNSKGLGLENTGAEINEKGFVVVDGARRTGDPRIWAIGDVAGDPMLAHKATHEAKVAVDSILGEAAGFAPSAIPAVVFTDPEIAWAGLTETQAKKEGLTVTVGRFPWGASGRALTLDRKDGVTKIICEPETGRVLGVGIAGPGAGELIGEGTLAIEMGALAEDLAGTIHAHPTLSETMMEGAELIFGSATHVHRPARRA